MIFDWDKYRELAKDLWKSETEAARRTAISRVYYTVYHRAKIYLENEGFQFRQFESSHRQIWDEFKDKRRLETRATGFGQIATKPITLRKSRTLICSSKGLLN